MVEVRFINELENLNLDLANSVKGIRAVTELTPEMNLENFSETKHTEFYIVDVYFKEAVVKRPSNPPLE